MMYSEQGGPGHPANTDFPCGTRNVVKGPWGTSVDKLLAACLLGFTEVDKGEKTNDHMQIYHKMVGGLLC